MAEESEFNPARYLTKLQGKDYLEVKWRLVWLRERHPDADITTDCTHLSDQKAVFKAHISIPGGGSATGWGSETPGDFRDYLEKAETKALGRALGALGFGTQFADDHEFGADQGRVVDAPVPQRPRASEASVRPVVLGTDEGTVRPEQIKQMWILARAAWPGKHEPTGEDLAAYMLHNELLMLYGKDSSKKLSEAQAAEYIETLKRAEAERLAGRGQEVMAGMPDEPAHIRDWRA